MKTQLKILGIIFLATGGFIAAFIVIVLLLGTLNGLGVTNGNEQHSFNSALVVFFVLAYPAFWIIQTGYNIFRGVRPGRLYGLVIGGILFVGLNTILLITKDPPVHATRGLASIHIVMIAIGLYSLILLAPKRAAEHFR
ncbi:hypothetical protein BH10ACI3_BH10ACI3_28640 [soil metagenome]